MGYGYSISRNEGKQHKGTIQTLKDSLSILLILLCLSLAVAVTLTHWLFFFVSKAITTYLESTPTC